MDGSATEQCSERANLVTVLDHHSRVSTVVPDVQWTMSDTAWSQIEDHGIVLAEVYRLVKKPDVRMQGSRPGEERLMGYGLSALVKGTVILCIEPGEDLPVPANVRLSTHAKDRCAQMGVNPTRVMRLVADPTMTYAGHDDRRIAWSAKDPDIAAVFAEDGGVSVVVTVIPRTYDSYDRATLPSFDRPELNPVGERDIDGAEALVREELRRLSTPVIPQPRPKRRKYETIAGPLVKQHVLDSIHPALRSEIARQVKGDFNRLIVHSPTRVEIKPA